MWATAEQRLQIRRSRSCRSRTTRRIQPSGCWQPASPTALRPNWRAWARSVSSLTRARCNITDARRAAPQRNRQGTQRAIRSGRESPRRGRTHQHPGRLGGRVARPEGLGPRRRRHRVRHSRDAATDRPGRLGGSPAAQTARVECAVCLSAQPRLPSSSHPRSWPRVR